MRNSETYESMLGLSKQVLKPPYRPLEHKDIVRDMVVYDNSTKSPYVIVGPLKVFDEIGNHIHFQNLFVHKHYPPSTNFTLEEKAFFEKFVTRGQLLFDVRQ